MPSDETDEAAGCCAARDQLVHMNIFPCVDPPCCTTSHKAVNATPKQQGTNLIETSYRNTVRASRPETPDLQPIWHLHAAYLGPPVIRAVSKPAVRGSKSWLGLDLGLGLGLGFRLLYG